jgi:hypothetical protein
MHFSNWSGYAQPGPTVSILPSHGIFAVFFSPLAANQSLISLQKSYFIIDEVSWDKPDDFLHFHRIAHPMIS